MTTPSSIGRVCKPIEVPNDQPWALDVRFWRNSAKTLQLTLTAASGKLLARGATTAAMSLTTTAGTISMTANSAGPRLDAPTMAGLTPGTYDFELQATGSDGVERQVRLVLDVIAGIS